MEFKGSTYLVRPYLFMSLAERIQPVPYRLSPLTKKWLAFQLLLTLRQHSNLNRPHGDIKPENVLLTSWDFLKLADMHPLKPVYLESLAEYN